MRDKNNPSSQCVHQKARGRALGLVPALAMLAMLSSVSGCASATSQRNVRQGTRAVASVSAASAVVKKFLRPVALTPPGPAFSAAHARGKGLWVVTYLAVNPFLAAEERIMTSALKAQGVKVHTCDGQGNPVTLSTCITQAIQQHPAAILVDGVDPSAFPQGVKAANAAKIPLLNGTGYDASIPLVRGLIANVSQPFKLDGRLAADWIIVNSKGQAHILFVTAPDVLGSLEEERSFAAELKSHCAACTMQESGVDVVDWPASLGSTTTSKLALYPDIDYVVPAFDPMAEFTDPAIAQAGKASEVKIVTTNGSLPQMQDLQAHKQVAADIGIDMQALGYLNADEVLRVLSGARALPHDLAPVRIFDASNAHGLAMTPDTFTSGSWYVTPEKYDAMMKKLWRG